MSYLLDTCLLSEIVKRRPNRAALDWASSQDEEALFVSVLTFGELNRGIPKLPGGMRKSDLTSWVRRDMRERFAGRILPVDEDVAMAWGRISGEAEARGRPVPVIDALLAATALVHDLTVVTRNGHHMAEAGVRVLDVWTAES